MRVPIPHDIGKEEVRRRLHARSHEIGQFVPGGVADVQTAWPNEDRMDLSVKAMGQGIDGSVIIEDAQVPLRFRSSNPWLRVLSASKDKS